MAHMKRIRFHAVNHKDSQHEFTKQISFGTLSSIFLTKPQRCPTLLIPLCDLNKNCTWPREQRWRKKYWEQFLGRRQWLWWHCSWMGLMWAHSWIQCLLATEAFFCPELGIQVLSPQQQSLSIKHEASLRLNSSQTIKFAIIYIAIIHISCLISLQPWGLGILFFKWNLKTASQRASSCWGFHTCSILVTTVFTSIKSNDTLQYIKESSGDERLRTRWFFVHEPWHVKEQSEPGRDWRRLKVHADTYTHKNHHGKCAA